MSRPGANVLLVGEGATASLSLQSYLEQLGCNCVFAKSSQEAISLIVRHVFHLILGTKPLHETDPLIAALSESDCTVFFSYPVEEGCWWLPLVRHGQKCLGAPAVRPNEFVGLLGRLVKEFESNEATAPKDSREVPPHPASTKRAPHRRAADRWPSTFSKTESLKHRRR
jgi:hypothetical protein